MNSLGLTALQPENNVYRILLEALAVTLSKDARARAVQLPAWNEALGLPRPWDQQWSLRLQQVLAYETDLLEYEDVLKGSHVIEQKTTELADASWAELQKVLDQGGSVDALEYMKRELVASLSKRQRSIESGEVPVVGVNRYQETAPTPRSGRSKRSKASGGRATPKLLRARSTRSGGLLETERISCPRRSRRRAPG